MRAAIVIPARLGSSRLPGKLLLRETGTPLVCHTLLVAAKARDVSNGMFREVVVAADSERIVAEVERFNAANRLGARALLTDPGHRSGSDRVAEAARSLPPDVDAVLNLQGDEPDLPPRAILDLAGTFAGSRADIATLAYPLSDPAERRNPALVKVVVGAGGNALYFSRADIPHRDGEGGSAPPAYGHVGVYLYRRPALERFVLLPPGALERVERLEQLRALENGMAVAVRILDRRPPKGIDTPEDYAAFVARHGKR